MDTNVVIPEHKAAITVKWVLMWAFLMRGLNG